MLTKLIILAAGEGSRLRPLTNDRPKCLIQFENGCSLLDLQIKTARFCGIDDIIVVKGYLSEKMNRKDVRYCHNKDYETTNMVESLWCAREYLHGDVIISYGDIVYEASVLKKILADPNDIAVVVDQEWQKYWEKRSVKPVDDAESLQINASGHITDIGQQVDSLDVPDAQYIGLLRFQNYGVDVLRNQYEKSIDKAFTSKQRHHVRNIYMTDLLQKIIAQGCPISAVKIKRKWLEIDTVKDYEIANEAIVLEKDRFWINC